MFALDVSQINWRTTVAHLPTEDTEGTRVGTAPRARHPALGHRGLGHWDTAGRGPGVGSVLLDLGQTTNWSGLDLAGDAGPLGMVGICLCPIGPLT